MATLVFTGREGLSRAGEWYVANAEAATGGTNLVNTILVDFRALDTFGELVVLAVGAVSVAALLRARPAVDAPSAVLDLAVDGPLVDPERNNVFLTVIDRALVPIMLTGSAYALLRGHNAPGGGFIAALVGVSALAGIGFTVSLLVAELSFGTGTEPGDHAKVGIFVASLVAAALGAAGAWRAVGALAPRGLSVVVSPDPRP